jgi:hypothetical protein
MTLRNYKMTEKEFNQQYQQLEAQAQGLKLNWTRIIGVADWLYGQYEWQSTIMMIKDCVDRAQEALSQGENPHNSVRQRLMHYLSKDLEKALDKGEYDEAA